MNIKHIYTITANPEDGSWEFFNINYTDSTTFRNNWCKALDGGSRIPSLDSLITDSGEDYINGEFYAFKSGKIEAAGMSGTGALCYWSYTFGKNHSIATEGCRYQEHDSKRKTVYFPNGLVNYKTCCRALDADGKPISKSFADTTYYFYDSIGRVIGYKKKKLQKNIVPIFSQLVSKHEKAYNQSYIGKTEIEKYFQQQLGYKPRIILFEIYRNAVLVFRFDEKQKRYIELEDVHLE